MSDNFILNKVFTRNTFAELINENKSQTYSHAVRHYIKDVDIKNNSALISEIYKEIKNNYRNEYFYKNTLLNKLLLGKHSLNTTTALTEIPISKSKADFILINGRAIVYEIKTELDTFERLDSQINDYYKAFNNVCVVTCESNYKRLLNLVGNSKVGIYILTDKNTVSIRREPGEDNSRLDHKIIFKVLRRKEFESIIKAHYGELPKTTQAKHYTECYKLFVNISIEKAYQYMLNELKKRMPLEIEEYKNVPYELKFLAYFSKYRRSDYRRLNYFLSNEFGG